MTGARRRYSSVCLSPLILVARRCSTDTRLSSPLLSSLMEVRQSRLSRGKVRLDDEVKASILRDNAAGLTPEKIASKYDMHAEYVRRVLKKSMAGECCSLTACSLTGCLGTRSTLESGLRGE